MLFNQYGYSLDTIIPYLYTSSISNKIIETLTQEIANITKLKKDIEKLLDIYIENREMTKKEYQYFSNEYQDIINKKSALNTLKNRKCGEKNEISTNKTN